MIDRITFPIDLACLYTSVKNIDRVELVLDVYDTLTRFFNLFVSPIIIRLVSDGAISDYKIGLDESDDAVVYTQLLIAFKRVERDDTINPNLLDDLGIGKTELINALKVTAAGMIEATLATCTEVLQDEAIVKGLRLSRVIELAAINEISVPGEPPTMMHLEAEYELERIREIGR